MERRCWHSSWSSLNAGRTPSGIAYVAADSLVPQAGQMLGAELRRTFGDSALEIRTTWVSTAPRVVAAASPDSLRLREVVELMIRYPKLRAELLAGEPADTAAAGAVARLLGEAGVSSTRIVSAAGAGAGVRIRLLPMTADAAPAALVRGRDRG